MTVATLLEGKRLVICGGSGGVGKTTCSAAIGLGLAAAGATVAVITIDPAKRLAAALGLRELDNEPMRVSPESLMSRGTTADGELWAMTLDAKRTFDDLIDRVAPDAERASDVKSTRIYRELSTAISGSQEFTAVAKLFELDRTGRFDVLVLDTPPSRNALDFLNAPCRLSAFLDGRALQVLRGPAGLGLRAVGRGASPLAGVLGRLSGIDLLADASAFFRLLGEMTDDFSRRAAAVEAMLRAPTTGFLLVTSAERGQVDETIWFGRTLLDGELPLTGVVVNRVHARLASSRPSPPDAGALLTRRLTPDLARRVAASAEAYESLVRRDELTVSRLRRSFAEPILTVPHLPRDVHDVDGLWELHGHLFVSRDAPSAGRPARRATPQ
jgi:anion-transporting  ArsA/GET3 family ATPase